MFYKNFRNFLVVFPQKNIDTITATENFKKFLEKKICSMQKKMKKQKKNENKRVNEQTIINNAINSVYKKFESF